MYDYWLGGKDNFAADRDAAEEAIAANPGIVADVRANRAFLTRSVRYLDIRTGAVAEMTRRMNQRLGGTKATMRDRATIGRLFSGLELTEPGVVQPQQWRPGPAEPGDPAEVTAWCGEARKP
jgi:S-adenosyl methyltransferase